MMTVRRISTFILINIAILTGGCSWFRSKPAAKASPAAAAMAAAGPALQAVAGVERQPLMAQIERLLDSMQFIGSPIPVADVNKLHVAMKIEKDEEAVAKIQTILDPYCL